MFRRKDLEEELVSLVTAPPLSLMAPGFVHPSVPLINLLSLLSLVLSGSAGVPVHLTAARLIQIWR